MKQKRSAGELIRRYTALIISLMIMAFGVAFTLKAELGTSPISSTPYVLSTVTPFTVGNMTIALHSICIVLQILILRKAYNPVQLIQLPAAIVFGYLTDLAVIITDGIPVGGYLSRCVLCACGIVLLAIGFSVEVMADVLTLAGDGFVIAVCKVTGMKHGNMKMIFDITLVAVACALSFAFHGRILGVREGTVAAAFLVGQISRRITGLFKKYDMEGKLLCRKVSTRE